ncbi:hypothetical protein MTO96_038472 [Rhipicephalus appendiculatus]
MNCQTSYCSSRMACVRGQERSATERASTTSAAPCSRCDYHHEPLGKALTGRAAASEVMEGAAAEFVGAVFPDALCVSLRRRHSEALTSPPPIAATFSTVPVSCTELEPADTLRQT